MPKPTKLHSKGKVVSMQKQCKLSESSESALIDHESAAMDHESAVRQFELELCWCIQQLERDLSDKKASDKQLQEAWKVLQVLKNNNQAVIRKRQLMRSYFGDYRAKMSAEEKKLTKITRKMKISEKPENPKATFLRKSAFLSTGDSSFRFNFDIVPEPQLEGCNNVKNSNTSTKIKTLSNAGDSNKNGPITEENSNSFKFEMTGSEFKFNFDVDSS